MAFVRVYTGDDGQAHIQDLDLLPANLPNRDRLKLFAATCVSFLSPLRCIQIYMSGGQYEVGPGDAILFEDITGQGHSSRVKGELVAADVALPGPYMFDQNLLHINP